jgi:CheY-like chemotaxis protein
MAIGYADALVPDSTLSTQRSAILRAEILRGDSSEVTCALEMTDKSVFIVTETLPSIGDSLNLRLSFPRAIRPLVVSVKVVQVRLSTGPGTPCGFVAEFDVAREDAQKRLADLAHRLRRAVTKSSNGKKANGGGGGTNGTTAVASAATTTTPPSRDAPSTSRKSVALLLVEDNRLIRDMFAYAVEHYFAARPGRVQLILAPTTAAAMAALDDRGGADLILVDQFLPDEPGTGLILKVRSHPEFHRIPIFGMSVGGGEVQRAMLEAGADLFLNKPIVLRDFFCTVEFLMDADTEDASSK